VELRTIGRSGLRVSAVGLGTNNFGLRIDLARSRRVVDTAMELGITFFDTADRYGGGDGGASEEFLGAALEGKRDRAVIGTKFGLRKGGDASRRHVMRAVEDSLRRLRTDRIDLYLLHGSDGRTPILETLQALDDLVREGKVLYVGLCGHRGWQLVDAHWTARSEHLARPIASENNYNLIYRQNVEPDVLPVCRALGVGLIPSFPLASGLLTGKYRGGQTPAGTRLSDPGPFVGKELMTPQILDLLDRLAAFAQERGHTLLDLAFAWLLGHPEIPSVIAGATSPEQVEQNVRGAEWRLTPAEMAAVEAQ
jgi:aryl-alcohol dehydrogenase-like predicted oxidoreductase